MGASPVKTFSEKDVSDYYDQTEVHYRMFWQLDQSMGLHYGIWEADTKSPADAILNVNKQLIELGDITSDMKVLDAGCGIGGSSIYLAKHIGCSCTGITLSAKQVASATELAKKNGVADKCSFFVHSYTDTPFEDNSFDIIWAIESFGSAQEKADFFREMKRVLKPGGKLLFADTFKPKPYSISESKVMQTMLNGWAISDILSVSEVETSGKDHGFSNIQIRDVSSKIKKSVSLIYYAGWLGMIGTKWYNLFNNASHFSKIHYKTGLAQKRAFYKNLWRYYLISMQLD